MSERPDLLDNRDATTTHADALRYLQDDVAIQYGLSVATGFVNLGGLAHLAKLHQRERSVRLMIGASPSPGLGARFPQAVFEDILRELLRDRDLSRFPPSRASKLLDVLESWLAQPEVEVRRYTDRFLHGKAYLFGTAQDARAALVTSANLTSAGLHTNLELGLVDYSPHVAKRAIAWFDELWSDAIDFKTELRDLLLPAMGPVSPRTVYLRALLELLEDFLDEPAAIPSGNVKLAAFQRDGFSRAIKILERHHGVIYADGVGTGKTEIGLALIEEYAVRRGLHALVVAPAQLVEMWRSRLAQLRLPAEVVSFHQFANDEQLAPTQTSGARRYVHSDKDTYRLVVVDEGHTLRTPGTSWYRAMSRLLGGVQKDLALLTATPINNGLWDLYHLVMAFASHDGAFADKGIPSLRQLFIQAGANQRDAENLDPDVLFELTDMVSVRRDRQFIETYYPGAKFPDGTPVEFPKPELATERYNLDRAFPGLVRAITQKLSQLKMARYRPSAYRLAGSEDGSETALGWLLQSAVLKRLESCWHACMLTVERMLHAHDTFLEAWDEGVVLSGESLRQAALADLDETGLAGWLGAQADADDIEQVSDFEKSFRADVNADRKSLRACLDVLEQLTSESDSKLSLLNRLLRDIPSEKVIVFSAFADTVRYLDAQLSDSRSGRQRVTVIGADTSPDERTDMLARFCPATVVRPDYEPPGGEVDLLLANDVLSEGQNLQQAAAVVSYDMPWNPQRVVQRFGRVIRLKSPHERVNLVTMLPEQGDLEMILQLEATIRRKIVAAKPYGMEIEVTSDQTKEEVQSFAARVIAGDETLLQESSESAAGYALSAEFLRNELQRAAAEGETERLLSLPWGIGAQFAQGPRVPSSGPAGLFFACRTPDGFKHWRYVTASGHIDTTPATMLRRINPGQASGIEPIEVDFDASWSAAADSIVVSHNEWAAGVRDGRALGPVQRWARALLEDPSVVSPPTASAAYEALAVDRNQVVRRDLSEIKRLLDEERIDGMRAAEQICEVVSFHGLLAVETPTAPEDITESDIGVVCWMSVLPQGA